MLLTRRAGLHLDWEAERLVRRRGSCSGSPRSIPGAPTRNRHYAPLVPRDRNGVRRRGDGHASVDHPEAHRLPPDRWGDAGRPGDRPANRSDPHPGRHGHARHARTRGDEPRPGSHRDLRPVRRPQPHPGGLQEPGRPPLPQERLPAIRHLVQPSRKRREPSPSPGALREAREVPAGVRQPYSCGGCHRYARDRCRWAGRRACNGRTAVPHEDAEGVGRAPRRSPAAVGEREGRHPRDVAAP